tara:strand:+ start:5641 stop:6747 length:1107 start_codon:yes stop_codon:yes gene_type:complete
MISNFKNFYESETPELEEGINDPAIFKAVFLAGGPGSGKSFVVGKASLLAHGFKLINSDPAFEAALAKAGVDLTPKGLMSPQGQKARAKAKKLTGMQLKQAIDGRLGLVIDGTGKDYDKIKTQAEGLRALGYEVKMLFVNTDLDTALGRNKMRPRSLPDDQVINMWKSVQNNIGKFQGFFRNSLIILDNSSDTDIEAIALKAYKDVGKWAAKDPKSPIAKKWISAQKKARGIKEETLDEKLDERAFGSDSTMKTMMPDLVRYLDRKLNGRAYKKAVRTFLDLRKKNPHNAERNLVKTAQIHDLDVRALDKVFKDMVKDGIMPKHLLNYRGFTKEEHGAGDEGTPELTKKLKKDTPGTQSFKEYTRSKK